MRFHRAAEKENVTRTPLQRSESYRFATKGDLADPEPVIILAIVATV